MKKIDLNCDMGESFGRYQLGEDGKVINLITSANIACGFHASDPETMEKTVMLAKENSVSIGAHPGYPDLQGFGRRNMNMSSKEIHAMIIYQTSALMGFCKANGVKISHVKPHGALYNQAVKDESMAEAIIKAVRDCGDNIGILAPYGSMLIKMAEKYGMKYACEVFADRAYNADGTLVPRSIPGSVIADTDKAVEQVIRMILDGKVISIDGKEVPIVADSVCVHGDGEKALGTINMLRNRFKTEKIEVCSCWRD